MNKAVFLDRDGVINELVYHQEQEVIDSPFTVKQFSLKEGVAETIKTLTQAGYLTVVVSNQPGIAKGQMSQEIFNAIGHKMNRELNLKGACLDGEYYCLHHPEALLEEYKNNCDCRKPKPGLILQAAKEMDIELQQSWMIGDNISDIQAGKSAGCRTILIGRMKCTVCQRMDDLSVYPEFIANKLFDSSQIILKGVII